MTAILPDLIRGILTVAVLTAMAFSVLALLARRRLITAPASASNVETSVRIVQTLALAFLTICILFLVADSTPLLSHPGVYAPLREIAWQQLGICTVASVACLAIGVWKSTTWATALLVIVLAASPFITHSSLTRELPAAAQAEIHAVPIPVTISVEGTNRPATVVLNGVSMGQSPVHTTVEEIQATVPEWQKVPRELGPAWNSDRRMIWQRVSLNYSPRPGAPTVLRKLFLRLEREGKLLAGILPVRSGSGSRGRLRVEPCRWTVTLDPSISNQAADRLLNIARLRNYQVEESWVDQFADFDRGVWEQLLNHLQDEPKLAAARDAVARRASGLDKVTDSSSAWQFLDAVSQKIAEQRSYRLNSPYARAIELLVEEHLDLVGEETLLSRFEDALYDAGTLRHFTWNFRWDTTGRRTRFEYVAIETTTDADFRLLPLYHAVQRLDQFLDVDPPESGSPEGNIVERRVVPLLLCLEQPEIERAAELGGPIIEQFFLRHDWKATPETDDYSPTDIRRYGHNLLIANAWFHRLIRLPSPLGKKLRREQQARILGELNQLLVTDSDGHDEQEVEEAISPCFIDDESRRLLATVFWPTFDRLAKTWPDYGYRQAEQRWKYLAGMWPYSTPQQFADVYMQSDFSRRFSISRLQVLHRIPTTDLFEILESLIAAARDREPADERPEARQLLKSIHTYNRETFEQLQRELPCPAAARRSIAHYQAQSEKSESRREQLRAHLVVLAARNAGWCAVFADSESTEIRELVPEAVRQRPTPENRRALQQLENDPDEAIRKAVVSTREHFNSLLTSR